jgi:hypothetical protein
MPTLPTRPLRRPALPLQDAAFAAAGLTRDAIAKADPAVLRSVLLYHSVSGYRPIPKARGAPPSRAGEWECHRTAV